MSKIISIANQKGGVGKSTITALTASALSQEPFNRRVYVADVDQQQSLIRRRLNDLQNSDMIPPYQLEYKTLSQLLSEIEELDKKNDLIFIDAPGKLDANLPADQQEITKVLLLSDFLFIPIVPGNFAMDATIDFLKIALRVKNQRKERPLVITWFVNMAEPRTVDDRFLNEEIEELQEMVNINFMDNRINRYALFRAADTIETLFDPNSTDRAKTNFSDWITEFIGIVDKN